MVITSLLGIFVGKGLTGGDEEESAKDKFLSDLLLELGIIWLLDAEEEVTERGIDDELGLIGDETTLFSWMGELCWFSWLMGIIICAFVGW